MLDRFIKNFKQSHGLLAKNGLIIGHIEVYFLYFLLCGLFWLCVLPWVISFMFGVV